MSLRDEASQVGVGKRPAFGRHSHVLLAVFLVCVLCPPILAAAPAKAGAAQNSDPAVLEEFNIHNGRPIIVPVRIQGWDYQFVLDTGASYCALDTCFREFLGKPIHVREVSTAGAPVTVEVFGPCEAYVGKLGLLAGGPVICADFEQLRRVMGREIRGLLGMGFLKRYVLRIDFDSGKLQFRSQDGRQHPEWGEAIHLYHGEEQEKEVLYAKGRLAGVGNIRFLVDSGRDGSVSLVTGLFERATDKRAVAERLAETFGGTRHFRTARINRLALGSFEHRGLVADEAQQNLIGLGLLSRYVVTLDLPSRKMYLQKGRGSDKRDEVDMSGLHLWRVDRHTAVHSVDHDSPAEAAGLKAEDVVLKIADQSAADMDIEELRDLLKSGDGKEIRMTIRRGAEEQVVSFRLKRKI